MIIYMIIYVYIGYDHRFSLSNLSTGNPLLSQTDKPFHEMDVYYVMRVPPNHPSQKPIVTWGSPFGGNPHCIPILAYMNPMIFP